MLLCRFAKLKPGSVSPVTGEDITNLGADYLPNKMFLLIYYVNICTGPSCGTGFPWKHLLLKLLDIWNVHWSSTFLRLTMFPLCLALKTALLLLQSPELKVWGNNIGAPLSCYLDAMTLLFTSLIEVQKGVQIFVFMLGESNMSWMFLKSFF